ncbi:SGNH/GDSL hydrolase family protein [Streptomyces hainanensis]|uniref:SGNH/GDSL hydrolase family protein n=1 Tax=Streptomyces hainanensis TaxID=402648 RepID=UPI001FB83B9A|nr:SGNH/GDSL hydrolase family protein [Streptomyces hainanensis]
MKPLRVIGRSAALVLALLIGALLLAPAPASAAGQGGRPWVGTWTTAPTTRPVSDTTTFQDQTLRQVVHASVGGDALRVRFSNEFGTEPLVIGEARIARQDPEGPGSSVLPRTDRRLTFDGRAGVTVAPGERLVSDPVGLRIPAAADLVISVHLPERTPGATLNAYANQENYVAAGNVADDADIAPTATTDRWYFLTGVSVRGQARDAVVALGDSITVGSTLSSNHRWSDFLAERMRAAGPRLPETGVLNAGISGNRLLRDPNPPEGSPAHAWAAYFGQAGVTRFERDVLSQPGIGHLILFLGINDIGQPGTRSAPASERVTAAELIAGYQGLVDRAHERGVRVIGATITPFRGDTLGFHTPENEAVRLRVNDWIRNSGEFDAVADFEAAVRDPAEPDRLNPAYDSGDHLHLNDAGNEALASAVPLDAFRHR